MTIFCEYYKGKEVLVTGGAGFIGSHLVEALVAAGARVSVLDNFSTGTVENLRSVMHKIHLIPHDVTSFHSCLRATFKKSHVFHCAAMVSVPQSVAAPSLCTHINVDGTKNILEACRVNKVDTCIFSSTAAIYGHHSEICCEDQAPDPQSPYASSKLEGEGFCTRYAQDHKLNTCALRYFNVFGPRQNPNGDYASVVPRFTRALLQGKPLVIYGDGTQTRDFVSVSEVVRANMISGMLKHQPGTIVNIASGHSITLIELIKKLEQELGVVATEILFEPRRPGDVDHSTADISRWIALQQAFDTMYGHIAPTSMRSQLAPL